MSFFIASDPLWGQSKQHSYVMLTKAENHDADPENS
jgi:hypothetical protein